MVNFKTFQTVLINFQREIKQKQRIAGSSKPNDFVT